MKVIKESSNSRLVNKFLNNDIQFAIISGCRPDNDRTRELKRDVRNLGFGFNEFIGRWVEDGINYDENSLLIPNISFRKAFELGQKYNQSSIIFKNKNGCKEYCTTPFENYDIGDIVREYKIDNDNPLNSETASQIFSGNLQGPASLLKKGSNKKAFNFKTDENFELYEKVLINTRYGFSNERIF